MKKYGLIGQCLDYSYSKYIHDYLIEKYDLEASYDLIEVANLNRALLLKYDGLGITIPYKETVLEFLDENKDNLVCNTIVNKDGYLEGYNTDLVGFAYLVKKLNLRKIEKIVILGSGATSKLVQHYFKDKETIIISRSGPITYDNLKELKADLLVNTTPVGMKENVSLLNEAYLSNYSGIIDLNYNPINSKLALDCAKQDIPFIGGLDMLLKQALKQFELWHGIKTNIFEYKEVKMMVLSKIKPKVALIGLSLSGKTTLVKKYGGIDLDEAIEAKYQESITKMLTDKTFRLRETIALEEVVNKDNQLIACGGGIMLDHKNMELLKDYLIIHLDIDFNVLIDRLDNNQRPLIKSETDLLFMKQSREKLYRKYANIEMDQDEIEVFLNEISNR